MEIKVIDYSKILSHQFVLSNISLELKSGNIYGLIGKNGSGKTMLMRAVCGLILPSSGCIKIDGKEIGKDISFPSNVGALIENPGFIPGDTGFQNLKNLARIRNKIDDKQIHIWLEKVGLNPLEKKTYRKYSLGMKQKLGIAAAMMESPELLVLDEPFNALDEQSINQVRTLILDAKNAGALILLACHDREEINSLCDKVFELRDGKLVSVSGKEKKE